MQLPMRLQNLKLMLPACSRSFKTGSEETKLLPSMTLQTLQGTTKSLQKHGRRQRSPPGPSSEQLDLLSLVQFEMETEPRNPRFSKDLLNLRKIQELRKRGLCSVFNLP